MGNGIGPSPLAVGFLKSDLRGLSENCLQFRRFHRQTVAPAPTRSIWYEEFPIRYAGPKHCTLFLFLRRTLGGYDIAATAVANREQAIQTHAFTKLPMVH